MNQPAEQGPDVSTHPSTSPGDRFSSYLPAEVTFLVKDLSRSLVEVTQAEYEQRFNQGRHYAEMLPGGGVSAHSGGIEPFPVVVVAVLG